MFTLLTFLNTVWTKVEDFEDLQVSDPGYAQLQVVLHTPIDERTADLAAITAIVAEVKV